MPKRVTRNWLSRVAGGLASGALALSLLVTGGGSAPGTGARPVLAEELDCYNDKDVYGMAECAAQRELDRKTGNAPKDASDPQGAPATGLDAGLAAASRQAGASGGQQQQQASGGGQPQGGGQQQQAAQGGEEEEEEKPVPRGPIDRSTPGGPDHRGRWQGSDPVSRTKRAPTSTASGHGRASSVTARTAPARSART